MRGQGFALLTHPQGRFSPLAHSTHFQAEQCFVRRGGAVLEAVTSWSGCGVTTGLPGRAALLEHHEQPFLHLLIGEIRHALMEPHEAVSFATFFDGRRFVVYQKYRYLAHSGR